MRECDNSKIHISNNSLLSICFLIMLDTLLLVPSLYCNTLLHLTTLHQTTLHFLSLTLHYSPIWLNPSTFHIVLFHPPSLNQTQYSSHIPKLISKAMNPFTALNNVSPFDFISLYIYLFYPINPSLHFTLPFTSTTHISSLHLPSLFTFYRLHFPHCFALS